MKNKNQKLKPLSYSLYFTGNDINALLLTEQQRTKTFNYYRALKPNKVYLEYGHQNEQVKDEDLIKIVAALRARGLTVAAAMVPAYKASSYCYNNPEHMGFLEQQSRFLAGLVDELIIDDWLFTVCKCPLCVKGRGKLSWADYRCKLLPAQTARHLLAPARGVNPGMKIIIKYPNWFEGHHLNGYAVEEQISQFDAYCIGVETRIQDLDWNGQHLPLYNAFFTTKWYQLCQPEKYDSTWIDNCAMTGHETEYVAQPVQAVLAGAREVILWSAGTHYEVNTWRPIYNNPIDKKNPWAGAYREFVRRLPDVSALAKEVTAPARGIPYYMPFGSSGEYNIFGFLGMAGLPLEPVIKFPRNTVPLCIFSEHAAHDKQLASKLLKRLTAGKEVFMTGGLYRLLAHTELGNAFQCVSSEGGVSGNRFTIPGYYSQRGIMQYTKTEMRFPRMQISTWPGDNRIVLNRPDGNFSILATARFLNGRIHLLNMPENADDLLSLPRPALDYLRSIFFPGFNVRLEAPARTTVYCYTDGSIVLYNLTNAKASATVVTTQQTTKTKWVNLLGSKKASVKDSDTEQSITVELGPYGLALLRPAGMPTANLHSK